MTNKRENNLHDKMIALFIKYNVVGNFRSWRDINGRLRMEIKAREVLLAPKKRTKREET